MHVLQFLKSGHAANYSCQSEIGIYHVISSVCLSVCLCMCVCVCVSVCRQPTDHSFLGRIFKLRPLTTYGPG